MPATIQGYRPDPRIRQTQLAELQRIYGEVVKQQQGAIVFLAGEPGSGQHATLAAFAEALRQRHLRWYSDVRHLTPTQKSERTG